jgi:hypothetical protein
MMDTARILDCGHPPSQHSSSTTGTAHTHDGKEICWSCADDQQRRDLLTNDHAFLYLTDTGIHGDVRHRYALTTWPGGRMMRITRLSKRAGYDAMVTPTGGWYDLYFLRAVDSWGQEWYGTSPGPGMYARMHKTAASKRKERTA